MLLVMAGLWPDLVARVLEQDKELKKQ